MTDKLQTAPEGNIGTDIANLIKSDIPITVDIPEGVEELKDLLLEQQNHLVRAQAQQGFCFLALKEKLPHGEFENWLKSAGFKLRTVREKMQVATFLLQVPEAERPRFVGLGQKKLISLSRLDSSIVDELLAETDEENGPDLEALSYKEMRDRIRKLESDKANLQVENETKDLTIRTLNDRAAQLRHFNTDYPDFVNITRDEANALATEVALRLDELERLHTELHKLPSSTDGAMVSIAATNLHIHVNGLAARACQLAKLVAESFGSQIEELSGEHLMTNAEIEQAIADRHMMIQELEQQRKIREDRREMQKPRKPGRPKKQ